MNRTGIEYLDYTLNIMPGCAGRNCAVSAACWAKGQLKRKKPYVDKKGVQRGCQLCYDFLPHVHVERFEEPFKVKKPSRIGLNFTGDTFDAWWTSTNHFGKYTSEDGKLQLRKLFEMCRQAYWHTFIILTKQPQNIPADLVFPRNVWLGVSVNKCADLGRIEALKYIDATVKFVSFEPLYEDVTEYWGSLTPEKFVRAGINWVIIGAQRRPEIQPRRVWVLNLEKAARDAECKIFRKNNLNGRFSVLQEIPEVKLA